MWGHTVHATDFCDFNSKGHEVGRLGTIEQWCWVVQSMIGFYFYCEYAIAQIHYGVKIKNQIYQKTFD